MRLLLAPCRWCLNKLFGSPCVCVCVVEWEAFYNTLMRMLHKCLLSWLMIPFRCPLDSAVSQLDTCCRRCACLKRCCLICAGVSPHFGVSGMKQTDTCRKFSLRCIKAVSTRPKGFEHRCTYRMSHVVLNEQLLSHFAYWQRINRFFREI